MRRRMAMPRSAALLVLPAIRGTPVGRLVEELAAELDRAGVVEPRTEARDLIAAIVGEQRFWPLLHRHALLDAATERRVRQAAARRAIGAPFAYAVGVAAFRHLTLRVDERVLIPRQETELLVDFVLRETAALRMGAIADVCTGSGAIALALATEGQGRFRHVIATDVSAGALSVAAANCERVLRGGDVRIELRLGHALAPLYSETLDVLVANPPYIAFSEVAELPRSVRDWEPTTALVSADDGLALTSELIAGAPELLHRGGLLALECDARRAAVVAALLANDGRYDDVCVHQDLTGRDRYVLARRA